MSDEEEDSMSEGFSASEEEWNPGKEMARNGESSDDDDSDFEEVPRVVSKNGKNDNITTNILKKNSKLAGVLKQCTSKKRKSVGQSLRAKLYNKYRPPPKTLQSPKSGQNSPSASTSRGQSKNYQTPNEDNDDSDTDGSVANYLVNPDDIDLRSSFYRGMRVSENDARIVENSSPVPNFDCNAGIMNRTDSDSEDNESSNEEQQQQPQQQQLSTKGFDFLNLLENANSLERAKKEIANKKQEKLDYNEPITTTTTTNAIDVNSLLALGEKQNQRSVEKKKISHAPRRGVGQKEEEEQEEIVTKLSKTKSTRVKRHTKTRPASTVATGDTDDSDWEEVAGRKRFQ